MATAKTDASVDMEELVTITLPLTREQQDDVFVSCNGRNMMIQRGKEVQIPRWAKEILDNKDAMNMLALERQRNLPRK